MIAWNLCINAVTADDVNAFSGCLTAFATVVLAIFAWKAWLSERKKTAAVRKDRDEGVKRANAAIHSMAEKFQIPQKGVPKIRVEGDTMYIDTQGE